VKENNKVATNQTKTIKYKFISDIFESNEKYYNFTGK